MQEFETIVSKQFGLGLNPNYGDGLNLPFLEECVGWKPDPKTLQLGPHWPVEDYYLEVSPSYTSSQDSFLPQIIPGEDGRYLLHKDAVEKLTEDTATPVQTYAANYTNPANPPAQAILPGAPLWDVAHFGGWIATNGKTLVFSVPHMAPEVGSWRKFAGVTAVPVGVTRTQDNRIIMAGFSGPYFASNQWNAIMRIWRMTAPSGMPTPSATPDPSRLIMVSAPPDAVSDYPMALELLALGYPNDGSFAKAEDALAVAISEGNIAFLGTPVEHGPIAAITTFNHRTVVFCERGMGEIVYTGERWVYKHIVSGLTFDSRFTIPEYLSLPGRKMIFADSQKHIWAWDQEHITAVGLEKVAATLGSPVICSVEHRSGDTYFSDGEKTLVVGQDGQSSFMDYGVRITGIQGGTSVPGRAIGEPLAGQVTTCPFDMGQRSMKTLRSVELSGSGIDNPRMSLLYRYQGDAQWRETEIRSLSLSPVVYFNVTAMEFKVRIYGNAGTEGRIARLNLRWTASDKRHIRGIYNQEG